MDREREQWGIAYVEIKSSKTGRRDECDAFVEGQNGEELLNLIPFEEVNSRSNTEY